MRGVIVFTVGFVAGVALLALVLWRTGSLPPIHAAAPKPVVQPQSAAQALPPIPPPNPLPDLQHPPAQAATLNPPPGQIAPEGAPHLVIPVQGIAAKQLHDDFNEPRDGHTHGGLDIPAPQGTPVLAAAEGNIVKLFNSRPGGLAIYQFDDAQTYCFYYAHLDHYAPGLKQGTLVRQGDVVGYVGATGDAPPTTPHLHFEVHLLGPDKHWWEGTAVDPYPMLTRQ